jgi:hypothetical protein
MMACSSVAPAVAIAIVISRSDLPLSSTSSTKYLVEKGRTRPAIREINMSTSPIVRDRRCSQTSVRASARTLAKFNFGFFTASAMD